MRRGRLLAVTAALGAVILAVVLAGIFYANRKAPSGSGSTPSPSPKSAEAEVEQAYLKYWDATAEALLKLDPAGLDEALTGSALEVTRELVDDQRRKNQPVRVRVEHNYRIVIVDESIATVDDQFIEHSVRLDPQTMQPVEPDPNKRIRNSYTLRKVSGRWKVAEVIGIESSPS